MLNFDLSEEQILLQKTVKKFSDSVIEPVAAKIDSDGKLPDNLVKELASLGLLGMTVPKQYGGSEASFLSCILACEQLAYSGSGAWWLVAFHNSIPEALVHFGSDYIKETFLKPLCDGAAYASIQFTEAETGSDPKSLITRAIPDKNGYAINGVKRFSTFGARDGYSMTFALDEEQNCTAFVVPKNTTGYSVSKKWELMGGGGIESVDVYYDNLHIPKQNLIGAKGKGFNILLYWIALEKIEQCAACVGMAQAALDEGIKFTKSRLSRGKPISDMQGVRWMLAEMQARIQASRWLTYRAAYLKDNNRPEWIDEAAIAKLMVVPATMEAVEISRRLHGSYGYTREFKIERLYRAIAGASAIATSLEINKSIVGSSLLK